MIMMIKGEECDTQAVVTENGSDSLTSTNLGVKKIKEKMIMPAIISLLSPAPYSKNEKKRL